MAEVTVLDKILKANEAWAEETRRLLHERRVLCVNLIGSPGSGKTTLLESSIPHLGDSATLAVIEGDIATSRDADRIGRRGVDCVQITTGNACHVDAHLVRQAIDKVGLDGRRMLFVENVGNLVCPAEFDIGEHAKVGVLSVPEGDEKPLKYPLLFQESALVVLTKTDLIPHTNFSREAFHENVRVVNPELQVMEVCCKTGDGINSWIEWLRIQYSAACEAGS
ncbi:MAG: hydrogenase nickel incorporation protein HypB [bacterium]